MPPDPAPETPAPKNYFAPDKSTFDVDLKIAEEEPAAADETPPQEPEEPAAAPVAANDDSEEDRTRASALGWKDPATAPTPTTAKGEPWLKAREFLDRFDPQKLYKRIDEITRTVDRRVEQRVRGELETVRPQIQSVIKHNRDQLAGRYRGWVAEAPDRNESLARQADMDKALGAFDAKFGGPAAAPAAPAPAAPAAEQPSFSSDMVEAHAKFVAGNKAWFGKNSGMTERAKEIATEVDAALPAATQFAEIERRMREEYGDHPAFRQAPVAAPAAPAAPAQPAARKAPDISGAPRRGTNGAGGGWAPLPSAAKAMFKNVHVPAGFFEDTDKDRERYAKQIEEDTPEKRGFNI
jgi:hypothetical protein